MNIALIGMPGSGKTTVSMHLGQRLNILTIDIDNKIEIKEKLSINEIFSIKGEEYFRALEVETIKNAAKETNAVISLGGGAFENPQTRDLLLNNSVVIYLKTSADVIFERIKNQIQRPLLKNNMKIESISKLLNIRENNYKLAHYTILTDNKSVDKIADEILGILGNFNE